MMGPFQLGSRVWPGLSKLTEEAGEVCQVAGKIMGTGGDPDHWDGSDLRVRMGQEVADLSAACRAFFQLNGYDGAPWVLEREIEKYHQFLIWHHDNLEDKPDGVGEGPQPYSKFQRWLGAGGELHHQIYWSWRVYRSAMVHTSIIFFMLGLAVATVLGVLF